MLSGVSYNRELTPPPCRQLCTVPVAAPHAGALGPVRFTIVRGPEGLNVVLGLENAAQRTLVELEQLPLQQLIGSVVQRLILLLNS